MPEVAPPDDCEPADHWRGGGDDLHSRIEVRVAKGSYGGTEVSDGGEDGRLRGIVTDRDIVLRCVAAEEDPSKTPVREIMSRHCVTVAPDADAREATRLMAAEQIRRLPVVEKDRVVGMLSLGDLARTQRFDMEASKALSEISENVKKL
ncbi:Inosine-5'-monophosphate dehydrogenase [bioreactor metagenome]|uniref:Inosine-5'-monophosphate dehydrogenase n=1 Tax=bioreactor metagenome TaxID=1076179 RepID=A0A645ER15_9ZZZZ